MAGEGPTRRPPARRRRRRRVPFMRAARLGCGPGGSRGSGGGGRPGLARVLGRPRPLSLPRVRLAWPVLTVAVQPQPLLGTLRAPARVASGATAGKRAPTRGARTPAPPTRRGWSSAAGVASLRSGGQLGSPTRCDAALREAGTPVPAPPPRSRRRGPRGRRGRTGLRGGL